MPSPVSRAVVLGLDCAAPELAFDRWLSRLPTLRRLTQTGLWGRLESTTPPITVPAWMSMMTGRDPGTLGIYGFRNRADHSYEGLQFANSRMVSAPTVWDLLGQAGKRVITLGIPLTYPPKPVNGIQVSGFLAPSTEVEYTYPADVKDEIQSIVGDYLLDVRGFRTNDRDWLLGQIYEMTRKRFELARHFLHTKPWDFFAMVEMGTDRIHHGFWRYMDPEHPLHEPNSVYQHAIRDYYEALDQELARTLEVVPDDALVLVVSDHGAKRMVGGICFNEWLIQEGYLRLKAPVESITKIEAASIDWEHTRAWGDGGYYGRLFLNVRGREPQGIVPPEQYEALRDELIGRLEALTDEHGMPINTRVFRPEAIYQVCHNVPPDLIVYFGDLYWRSVGSLGHGSVWTHTNDTGPDDANHSQHGLFALTRPGGRSGQVEGASIYDIAPTLLRAFGLPTPDGLRGKALG